MSDQFDGVAADTFGGFLRRKYHELSIKYPGRFNSLAEFGLWIHPSFKQSTFSTWLNNTKTPSGKNVDLLAAKLGVEVYDRLGLERKVIDPKEKAILWVYEKLGAVNPEKQDEFYQRVMELKRDLESQEGAAKTKRRAA